MLLEFYRFIILQFFPVLFRYDAITTGLIVTRADSHGIIPTLPHYSSHIIFFRSVNGFFTSYRYDEGGDGGDTLTGGASTGDIVSYASSDAAVTVNLTTPAASGGHAEGDTISGFEGVIGSAFDDTLTGTTSDNTLSGGAGDDILIGGEGADTIDGGAGNDTVSYEGVRGSGVVIDLSAARDAEGYLVIDDSEGGTDRLKNIENILGSIGNDTLTGDDGDNILDGATGGDILTGGTETTLAQIDLAIADHNGNAVIYSDDDGDGAFNEDNDTLHMTLLGFDASTWDDSLHFETSTGYGIL